MLLYVFNVENCILSCFISAESVLWMYFESRALRFPQEVNKYIHFNKNVKVLLSKSYSLACPFYTKT